MGAPPLRILIVEDDHDSARMLRVLLKRSGYETRVEHDGSAALSAVGEFRPQVVLLDQTLVGMSGAEVATLLRSNPEGKGCVIVAITGHGKESLPSPSPFDGHFQKPIDHDALLDYLSKTEV